ncbi:MAG: A/G-specific adenine glycosylase [Planctomycetaceae bacterium]
MPPISAQLDTKALPQFRRALVAWYRRHARSLPWRATHDPYAIWISEIMLQQTTVAAVVPYFDRFVRRFPSVRSLAAAEEDEVLRLWEGLGYYSRARNIHKAARALVAEHGGRFPQQVAELVRLPGVGRYTAGAIASFAFDLPAPIVEANTLRLYSRLLGYRGNPRAADGQRALWSFAEAVLPRKGAGLVNQALMELGATVCTPDEPACDRCPVRRWCVAAADGSQAQIPEAPRRIQMTDVTEIAVAVRRKGRYLLLKRAPGERWAGLWDFVRFPLPADTSLGREMEPGTGARGPEQTSPPLQGGARGGRTARRRTISPPLRKGGVGGGATEANGKKTDRNSQILQNQATITAPGTLTREAKVPSPLAGKGSRLREASVADGHQRRLAPLVYEQTGIEVEMRRQLGILKHGVTRYRITLECYLAEWQSGEPPESAPAARWAAPGEFAEFPLSTTGRHLARLLARQT